MSVWLGNPASRVRVWHQTPTPTAVGWTAQPQEVSVSAAFVSLCQLVLQVRPVVAVSVLI